MQDLGTLANDYASLALGINGNGKIVGASTGCEFQLSCLHMAKRDDHRSQHANQMAAPACLLLAESINNRGEIVGYGATNTGQLHGFLAIPDDSGSDTGTDIGDPAAMLRPVLANKARQLLRQQLPRRYYVGLPR